jgi:hypothetical protein
MLKFEGVVFNAEWAATQTQDAFVKHESHHGLSKDQLREVHRLCIQQVKPQQKEKPVPKTEIGD